MTTLSTHVLDLTTGRPAAGMNVRLMQNDVILFSGVTDGDGRCAGLRPVKPGRYHLGFDVAEFYRGQRIVLPNPPFLDQVEIAFGVADADGHYHVPLLVSPFSYSTYRGS